MTYEEEKPNQPTGTPLTKEVDTKEPTSRVRIPPSPPQPHPAQLARISPFSGSIIGESSLQSDNHLRQHSQQLEPVSTSKIFVYCNELAKQGYRPKTIQSHSRILRFMARNCDLR